jgi:tetratricopeptide (TPR) repeat protein
MTIRVMQALSNEWPFPGLRPFDYGDQDFFFGRRNQVASLYGLLDRSRFVAVIGSSGCGKSSLTRAGLLPILEEENTQSRSGKWIWCSMRPGDAPLAALADALANMADKNDNGVEAMPDIRRQHIGYQLNKSSFGLADAVAEAGVSVGDRFVLVVDQFEELFRYSDPQIDFAQDRVRDATSRNEARQFVELLMEGRRSTERDIRVLITMRSDFIGDCADFPGLPEAVSATQFLVPGLERDQIELIVEAPIEKAGAKIEPALVQQLLTDVEGEPDQLPVLQHCLLQLWQQAGSPAAVSNEAEGAADNSSSSPDRGTRAADRVIDSVCYEKVGKISNALTVHAEKILLDFREEAVEAVFRALSEIKDGRAIRRALPYEQLREECGIPDDELRKIVDRFRADDCSFLVTSPSGVDELRDDTVIDVGHEALLRRWERIRGAPGATGDSGDKLPIGWLRQERKDGRKYQILLSMLDGAGASRKVEDIKRHWNWWNERTRTPRWAERYGGKYQAVDKLLNDGWMHRRVVLVRDCVLAGVGALIVLYSGYLVYEKSLEVASKDLLVTQNARLADENFARSVTITTRFLQQVLDALNRHQINVFTARRMEESAQSVVGSLQKVEASLNTIALEVQLNVIAADILSDAGALPDAMERAQRAKDLAQKLSQTYLDNDALQTLLRDSALRLGDALEVKRDFSSASQQFGEARSIAQKLADKKPDDGSRQSTLAFAIGKVGEVARYQDNYEDAISLFSKAMDIATNVAAKSPDDPGAQAYVPNLLSKIADSRTRLATPDIGRALEEFNSAITKQNALSVKFPDDIVVWSNLSLSHRRRAEALVKDRKWNEAFEDFKSAIAIRDKLVASDGDNASQLSYLAADHDAFAEVLMQHGKTTIVVADYNPSLVTALSELRQELVARKRLVEIDSKNPRWSREMAATQEKIEKLEAQIPPAAK